jgi:nonribosomal peptide synthetase DhbF
MCELFAEVLGLPQIDARDNFFDLGGHSLLASKLVRTIHSRFGATVPLRAVYETPTAHDIAKRLVAS